MRNHIRPPVLLLMATLTGACLVSSLPAAPLKVNPNFTVEDCGTPLKALRLLCSTLYKHPDTGKLHLFCEWGNNNGYGIGEEEWEDLGHRLVDVELESGEMRRTKGATPGGQASEHYFHPDGKIYICEGKSKPASLASYDTRTGRYERIGYTAGSPMRIRLGPTGKLYMGEQGGDVTVFDPAHRTFLRYQKPTGAYANYVYTMEVEEPFIYCGISVRGNWFLTVIDTLTSEYTNYFSVERGQPPSRQTGRNDVRRTETGNLAYGPYPLKDGKPSMDAEGKPVPLPPPDSSAKLFAGGFPNMWGVTGYGGRLGGIRNYGQLGIMMDMEDAEPNNWNDGIASIRWRKTDEQDWRTIQIKGLEMVPYSLKVLGIAPDGRMIGVGNMYGSVTRFDPKTGKSERVGEAPGSCYSILPLNDVTYFCGYVAFMAEYDHSKPYNVQGDPAGRNPKNYNTGTAKWTRQMLLGPDGRIYLGGKDGRHNTGGGIAIFDPKTKQMKHIRGTHFELLGVSEMTFLSDNRTLVIITSPVLLGRPGPEKGSVYLFDITQDKIVKEIVLDLPKAPDEVLVAGDNTVLGVSRVSERDEYGRVTHYTSVAGLDLANGKVTFEKRHPGRAFAGISPYDKTPLVRGPDGCGWLFVDEWLCRLLPSGDLDRIRKLPEYRGTIIFHDRTAYIHNGGRVYANRFANVVRIPNLFAD